MAKFHLDSNVALDAADFLHAAGHDVLTARAIGMETGTDDEHLLVSAQHGRILITHNERDFILLHDAWCRWAAAWDVPIYHEGILIVPQGTRYGTDWAPSEVARAILTCVRECVPLVGHLFRWKEVGWQRRQQRDWIQCS